MKDWNNVKHLEDIERAGILDKILLPWIRGQRENVYVRKDNGEV